LMLNCSLAYFACDASSAFDVMLMFYTPVGDSCSLLEVIC
jgi:hypothetical protein